MVGIKLTKVLSHVDTSQHFYLVYAHDCSNDLCVVLDGRSALFPSGKSRVEMLYVKGRLPETVLLQYWHHPKLPPWRYSPRSGQQELGVGFEERRRHVLW